MVTMLRTLLVAAAMLALATAQCTPDCDVDRVPIDPNTQQKADVLAVRCQLSVVARRTIALGFSDVGCPEHAQ